MNLSKLLMEVFNQQTFSNFQIPMAEKTLKEMDGHHPIYEQIPPTKRLRSSRSFPKQL